MCKSIKQWEHSLHEAWSLNKKSQIITFSRTIFTIRWFSLLPLARGCLYYSRDVLWAKWSGEHWEGERWLWWSMMKTYDGMPLPLNASDDFFVVVRWETMWYDDMIFLWDGHEWATRNQCASGWIQGDPKGRLVLFRITNWWREIGNEKKWQILSWRK